jgi:uncharacterized protein (DUF302 family)
MTDYGYTVDVPEGYDEAVIRARLALRAEGFSILTEMHVGGMLGPEAGDERQYLFMGAWSSPEIELLDHGIEVASHLPCNVVVQEKGDSAYVAALDPGDALADDGATVNEAMAEHARMALSRAFQKISSPA